MWVKDPDGAIFNTDHILYFYFQEGEGEWKVQSLWADGQTTTLTTFLTKEDAVIYIDNLFRKLS